MEIEWFTLVHSLYKFLEEKNKTVLPVSILGLHAAAFSVLHSKMQFWDKSMAAPWAEEFLIEDVFAD